MARRGFKPSLREQREASLRVMQFMAGAAPAHKREAAAEFIAGAQGDIKPKRERAAPRSLEGPVVAAISELLAVHPNVRFAVRQNSGMASYEAKSGRYQPVFFYRILRHAGLVTITDFWGLLQDGRFFALEAKNGLWRKPSGERENKQEAFLGMVRSMGGVGAFVRSADEAQKAIERS